MNKKQKQIYEAVLGKFAPKVFDMLIEATISKENMVLEKYKVFDLFNTLNESEGGVSELKSLASKTLDAIENREGESIAKKCADIIRYGAKKSKDALYAAVIGLALFGGTATEASAQQYVYGVPSARNVMNMSRRVYSRANQEFHANRTGIDIQYDFTRRDGMRFRANIKNIEGATYEITKDVDAICTLEVYEQENGVPFVVVVNGYEYPIYDEQITGNMRVAYSITDGVMKENRKRGANINYAYYTVVRMLNDISMKLQAEMRTRDVFSTKFQKVYRHQLGLDVYTIDGNGGGNSAGGLTPKGNGKGNFGFNDGKSDNDVVNNGGDGSNNDVSPIDDNHEKDDAVDNDNHKKDDVVSNNDKNKTVKNDNSKNDVNMSGGYRVQDAYGVWHNVKVVRKGKEFWLSGDLETTVHCRLITQASSQVPYIFDLHGYEVKVTKTQLGNDEAAKKAIRDVVYDNFGKNTTATVSYKVMLECLKDLRTNGKLRTEKKVK